MTTEQISDLQARILSDLRQNPGSAAAEIAQRIGRTRPAVSTALTWLRGWGYVDDGNADALAYYNDEGKIIAYSHPDPTYPRRWKIRQTTTTIEKG